MANVRDTLRARLGWNGGGGGGVNPTPPHVLGEQYGAQLRAAADKLAATFRDPATINALKQAALRYKGMSG